VLPALHKLQKSRGYDPDSVAWLYTVAMSTLMGTLAGVVQSIMGSPGDLPETIAAIHEKARLRLCLQHRVQPAQAQKACAGIPVPVPCIEAAAVCNDDKCDVSRMERAQPRRSYIHQQLAWAASCHG